MVIDHLKGTVVWVREGKSADTLRQFFAELGPERAARLEAVTIDMSAAYIQAVTEATPNALPIFDRFHVQRLAHDALDAVRREQMRAIPEQDLRKAIKGVRFALQKNPWNLRQAERAKLAQVQRENRPLYRAYLLKETLLDILDRSQPNVVERKLSEWLRWAARSRLRCRLAPSASTGTGSSPTPAPDSQTDAPRASMGRSAPSHDVRLDFTAQPA